MTGIFDARLPPPRPRATPGALATGFRPQRRGLAHRCGLGRPFSRSSGRKSPVVLASKTMIVWRSCRHGNRRRAQLRDQPQDVSEQMARDGDFGHLKGDVAAVADDLCADLDQLLAQTRQRPLLNRFGYRERAQEIAEVVRQGVELKANGIGAERATRQPRPSSSLFSSAPEPTTSHRGLTGSPALRAGILATP